jgi:hypothetical protein
MIDYTLIKSKGLYTVEVVEETTYKLLYISTNKVETILNTTTILANTPIKLTILKDGLYKLVLAIDTLEETEEEFYVFKYLQENVIENIQKILCKECVEDTAYCDISQGLSPKEQMLLKTQSIFNNTLLYQNYCLPFYGTEYLSYFANYLSFATELTKEKIQKELNIITATKIIKGTDVYNESLFRTSLFIYWAGFYFTEKFFLQDAENAEEVLYLEDKFKVSEISTCAEDLTFSFTQLETIFNTNINMTQIYQHQLDFVGQGIEDLVEQEFYTNNYTQAQLLTGVSITFSKIAKFGFIVKDASKNPYKIIDTLGSNITDSFDYYFIDKVSYYLSKENVSYATISFKFQKNN